MDIKQSISWKIALPIGLIFFIIGITVFIYPDMSAGLYLTIFMILIAGCFLLGIGVINFFEKKSAKNGENPRYGLSFFAQPSPKGTAGEKVEKTFKQYGDFVDKMFSPTFYFNFFRNLFKK